MFEWRWLFFFRFLQHFEVKAYHISYIPLYICLDFTGRNRGRFRNMWTLSDPSPSPEVGFMKWVKVKSKSGKHRNKRMHLKTNVCGCLTCNIFFSISHMHLAFEFHIAAEFPPAVRWGVVLGCDGGDRLEQSLGCGTDGKSLRLSDGQIGYRSTGGQNADNMVVEIIFPGNMAIPHFLDLVFMCRKRLDGKPWNLRDSLSTSFFLISIGMPEIN